MTFFNVVVQTADASYKYLMVILTNIWLVGAPWLTFILQLVTIIAEAFVWHPDMERGGEEGGRGV